MSENAKDLIRSFLSSSQKRLGKDGVESIKQHPFFQNDEWTFETIRKGFYAFYCMPDCLWATMMWF